MEIIPKRITIRDLANGYRDDADGGVFGLDGKLNIRPPYQREFIYADKERDAVITTVLSNYPLNVMYWADNGDGTYEVIDGQQRTISICQYVTDEFSYEFRLFSNLTEAEQKKILDYELMVYVCKGNDDEKLKWFETINIAGKVLNKQELRNASYAGPFVTDAKRYFSKPNGPAYNLGKLLITGSPKRQDYLETALEWICHAQNLPDIRAYMDAHKHDNTAIQLWNYYTSVIQWVNSLFYTSRRSNIMLGLNWGALYEKYGNDTNLNKDVIEARISTLIKDSDVTNKRGIIPYILSGDERTLSIRLFGEDIKEEIYEEQRGICPECGQHFEISEMEAHHIKEWSEGGRTIKENCQMLCRECHRNKGNRRPSLSVH